MAENKYSGCCNTQGNSASRSEMVSIETNRILDSCRDRDCFEDVKVLLTDFGYDILERTTNIRAKKRLYFVDIYWNRSRALQQRILFGNYKVLYQDNL